MIFDFEDDDLKYGMIGLGTFATPVAFDEINLRPIVNDKKYDFSPDDLPNSINADEDLFFYNLNENPNMDECAIDESESDSEPSIPQKPRPGSDSPSGPSGPVGNDGGRSNRNPNLKSKLPRKKIWRFNSLG